MVSIYVLLHLADITKMRLRPSIARFVQFFFVLSTCQTLPDNLAAGRSLRISNDLYGSDTMSSFEMARGFTKPVLFVVPPKVIDHDLLKSHDELVARCKLNCILLSNFNFTKNSYIVDLIQDYLKHNTKKRGKLSSPKQILSINHYSGLFTVPGRSRRTMNVAYEDVHSAFPVSDLTYTTQCAIYEVDSAICEVIDQIDDGDSDVFVSIEDEADVN